MQPRMSRSLSRKSYFLSRDSLLRSSRTSATERSMHIAKKFSLSFFRSLFARRPENGSLVNAVLPFTKEDPSAAISRSENLKNLFSSLKRFLSGSSAAAFMRPAVNSSAISTRSCLHVSRCSFEFQSS